VKANQGKMQFGSAGVGAGTHLPCELLNATLGVKVTHVPFKGAGPVMQELIAGRIDYFCDTIQTGAAQAKAGAVKGLAVMSPRRVPIIPDLATTGEQGVKGVEATVWNGFFFPKGTPDAIVRRMNKVMNTMIEEPAMRSRLQELGLEILPPDQRTPEYLAKYLAEDVERWKKVIVQAGIPVE
jgi:tripartite-type tricarboxylate transporter receptor subunit TctC